MENDTKKLGKEVKRPSLSEVKTNKYREKKGLPPLKVKKKWRRNARNGSARNIKERNVNVVNY